MNGEHLAVARKMLADAEAEYNDGLVKMADAAPHVRRQVLDFYQSQMDEARAMIEIFKVDND